MFARLTCIVLVASLGFSGVAQAQTAQPSAADAEQANTFFKSAKAAFAAGNLHEAHRLYSSAWELKKSPDIAANLAQAELELGKMKEAAQHFSFALQNLLPSSTEQQRAALEQGLAASKAEVMTLELAIAPDGAEVFIDGTVLGTAPISGPIFLDPGEHAVVAQRSGFVTGEAHIAARKGGAQKLELTLAPAGTAPAPSASPPPSAQPAAPASKPDRPSPSLVPAYIATGVAVVGLGAGVGFVLMANGSASDAEEIQSDLGADNSCGKGTPFTARCAELDDSLAARDTATTLAIAGFALGAVSGGLAAYLFVNAASSSPAAARWTPVVALTPHAGALGVRGRF